MNGMKNDFCDHHNVHIRLLFLIAALIITTKVEATNFYISSKGNDAANGLTPSTSWLTIEKINKTKFYPGDSILFNRGDAWREGQALYGLSNGTAGHPIVFGAYGSGAKPLILASKDISTSVFWTKSSENIWKTTSKINITTKDLSRTGQITPDVANLIFNNEESIGVKKRFLEGLTTQGDFSLNLADTLLYLYSAINPSTYYSKIEATGIRNCENNIEVINGQYLTFVNLDIRYSKNNGLFLNSCSNIEISNCDFSWIGGCYYPIQTFMQNPDPNTKRMGNGVQLWKGNSDIIVKNCYINQVYDAGISPQGNSSSYSIKNLKFHHNLINNCYYSFEFWGRPSTSTGDSIYFENNTCLNSGYGWSTAQRPDKGGAAHLKFFDSDMVFSSVFIRNNIFDESVDFCLYSSKENSGSNTDKMWAAFTLDYNCYYQSNLKQVIRWRGAASQGGNDYFMTDIWAYKAKSLKEYYSIFADPMLTSNFALQTNSPAIDAGIYVGYPYSGMAPNIGSFEYITGGNQPPSIKNQSFKISKNVTNGTSVGIVVASDPDVDQSLTYSILSGNSNGAFAINATTGMLTVASAAVLYSNFGLVVKVQDNGIEKLSNQAVITINLLTGIELTRNNKLIKVYPNPVSDELIIDIEGKIEIPDFEILNSLGQIVFKGNLSEKTIVQTTNFAPGIYLLKHKNGMYFEFKKIVKL
jgi:hypothetical protein